jgi:hypothetical protein
MRLTNEIIELRYTLPEPYSARIYSLIHSCPNTSLMIIVRFSLMRLGVLFAIIQREQPGNQVA